MFQKLLVDSLQKLIEYADKAEGFLIEQVPLLCNEIIRWGLVSNLIGMTCFIVLFIGFLKAACYAYKTKPREDFENNSSDRQFCIVGLYISSAAMWIGIIPFGLQVAKILTAPRLYLLEYINTNFM